jgi:hypothetical protein
VPEPVVQRDPPAPAPAPEPEPALELDVEWDAQPEAVAFDDEPVVALDDEIPSWAASSLEYDDDPVADAQEAADRDPSYERELAVLSPRAAAAVQAVDGITDADRRAAAEEAIGDDADSINRGLLLKFLSSVKD